MARISEIFFYNEQRIRKVNFFIKNPNLTKKKKKKKILAGGRGGGEVWLG